MLFIAVYGLVKAALNNFLRNSITKPNNISIYVGSLLSSKYRKKRGTRGYSLNNIKYKAVDTREDNTRM